MAWRPWRALAVLAAALGIASGLAALLLIGSHASVRARSTGEELPCLATWDIVLNGAHNDPDGDPGLPHEDIGGRCETAAHRRFDGAIAAGVAGLALGAAAVVASSRGPRAATP